MIASRDLTIAVETMASPYARAGLNCVAECLAMEGYQVTRWQGPYARRFKFVASTIPNCDAAVIWNGLKPRYQTPVKTLRRRKIPFLVMEVGWHPQKGTYQIDRDGINIGASWVKPLLTQNFATNSTVSLNPKGTDLLVIMQNDTDSQITHYSPHFDRMSEFLSFLIGASQLPLRVRFHPRHPPGFRLKMLIRRNHNKLTVDRSESLTSALGGALAVACVNSSSAVEAMERQLPVLCFGESIYGAIGAVYRLDRNPEKTRQVTRELSMGRCELDRGSIEAVISKIKSHQLTLDQIPKQVAPMMESLISSNNEQTD